MALPNRNIASLIPAAILSEVDTTNPMPPSLRFAGEAAEAFDQFTIVYISDYSGGIARFSKADADAATTAPSLLFLTLTKAVAAGDEVLVTLGPVNVDMNTFGMSINEPVYLSGTAGGTASTPGVITRKVGEVAVVAVAGSYTFCGWMASVGGTSMALDYLLITRLITGIGEAFKITATASHASSTAEGADISIEQVTNVRTGGSLIAVKGTVISLTGSTAGVDHVVFDANATAGDADSDHIGLRLGSAIDVTIDSRAQGTGKNLWKVGDNLASALDIQEGSNSYLKVVTTNSSERTEIRAPIPVGPTSTAITGATTLTVADAGRIFTVAQSSAYDIDLPAPPAADYTYRFQLVSPGAFNVTITVAGAAATFEGVIVNDVTSVVPATGSTLTFATGTAVLGDYIEVTSTSSSKYCVRAISSANGGVTVS